MNSTLSRPAAPAPLAPCALDLVLLPAAAAAPSALVIAVDAPLAQETSAWTQLLAAPTAPAAHAYAMPSLAAAVTARDIQGPPSRGTPV